MGFGWLLWLVCLLGLLMGSWFDWWIGSLVVSFVVCCLVDLWVVVLVGWLASLFACLVGRYQARGIYLPCLLISVILA